MNPRPSALRRKMEQMTYRDVVAELRIKLAIEDLRNKRVTHSDVRRNKSPAIACDT